MKDEVCTDPLQRGPKRVRVDQRLAPGHDPLHRRVMQENDAIEPLRLKVLQQLFGSRDLVWTQ